MNYVYKIFNWMAQGAKDDVELILGTLHQEQGMNNVFKNLTIMDYASRLNDSRNIFKKCEEYRGIVHKDIL